MIEKGISWDAITRLITQTTSKIEKEELHSKTDKGIENKTTFPTKLDGKRYRWRCGVQVMVFLSVGY